jgi:hypothetical protein
MSEIKFGVTDPEDWERAFGAHENKKECCVEYWIETRNPGPCPRCELASENLDAWNGERHWCVDGEPECEPFLTYIHERSLSDDLEKLECGEGFSDMWFWRNGDSDERVNARISLYEAHGYVVEPTKPAPTVRYPINEGWHIFKEKEGKLLQFRRA